MKQIEPISEVFNEDCELGMTRYRDKFFDLAIVDPPYGIKVNKMSQGVGGKRSAKGEKKYKKGDWDNATPTWRYFNELYRVSKHQIIWGANYMTQYLPPSMGWIFWDKGQRICNSDGELAYSSFDRALRVVEINRVALLQEGTIHPTQKPVRLYKWLLENYAKPGATILDTHVGSGSSRIAAYKMGFDFTGFELDPVHYLDQEERFKKAISEPLFDEPKKDFIQVNFFDALDNAV